MQGQWGRVTYRILSRLVVNAYVGDVHGIGRSGDGGPTRGPQDAVDKARECTLLFPAVRLAVLGLCILLCLIAVALAGALRPAI
jgi:hypothetical protein